MTFRAEPGCLPAVGQTNVAGVELPSGYIVTAEEADDPSPIAWISAEVLDPETLTRLIRQLAAVFPQTGLWPLAAQGLDEDDLSRPWGDGEFDGPDPRTLDAQAVFSGAIESYGDEEDSLFSGLAEPVAGSDLAADQLEIDSAGALLLVPVDRPANVPKMLGWMGACNQDLGGEALSAVLRSWEDRFGATLAAISFDTLTVQVPRLPTAASELDKLLGEHYAFCPDNIDQGLDAAEYREALLGWKFWSFWWD